MAAIAICLYISTTNVSSGEYRNMCKYWASLSIVNCSVIRHSLAFVTKLATKLEYNVEIPVLFVNIKDCRRRPVVHPRAKGRESCGTGHTDNAWEEQQMPKWKRLQEASATIGHSLFSSAATVSSCVVPLSPSPENEVLHGRRPR